MPSIKNLKKTIRKAPVIIKYDDKKWFGIAFIESNEKLNVIIFYSSAYSETGTFMMNRMLSSEKPPIQIWPIVFEDEISLQEFERNQYKREPTIYQAEDIMESVRNSIRRIGYTKLVTFINDLFPSLKIKLSNVRDLINDLDKNLDFALLFLLLHNYQIQTYKISKKIVTTLSSSIEKLLTFDIDDIIVREPYSNKLADLSSSRISPPSKWGADERILLYDVILREYSMKPRTKIIFVKGKQKLRLTEEAKEKAIVITPKRIRELTNLDKYSISRIIGKFQNLRDDILVFEGYTAEGLPIFTKRILIKPLEKAGIRGYIVGVPDNELIDVEFYELTSFATKLLEISESSYTVVESALFARLKNALPTKAQDVGARLLERIIQKGKNAFLTLEEIATLMGKRSYLKWGKKNAIIEKALEYLETFKTAGIIKDFWRHGDGFEVEL